MPRRRRHQENSFTSKLFSVVLCIIVPLGVAGLLIAATVANFKPRAVQGYCHAGPETNDSKTCDTLSSGPPRDEIQYRVRLPDIRFTAYEHPDVNNKTCELMRNQPSMELCQQDLDLFEEGKPGQPCWRSDGKSWFLGPSNPECWFDSPQSVDTFDRTLPLTCAAALMMGAGCFWAPKIKKWWITRRTREQRRRERAANEQTALLQRGSVPCVVKNTTVDLFSVSAAWTGPESAAVIVGNAEGGAYPCEVQKVFDVGTTITGECVVCLEFPKAVVLWPCRHLCACIECAPKLRKCPICRSTIRRRLCLELTAMEQSPDDEEEEDDEDDLEDPEATTSPKSDPLRNSSVNPFNREEPQASSSVLLSTVRNSGNPPQHETV